MTNFYKYVSPERIDGLLNGKIRFTQPGAFNDPFEIPAYKLIRAKTLAGAVSEAVLETARAWAAIGNLTEVSAAMATVGTGQSLGLPPLSRSPSSFSATSLPSDTSVAQPARLAQRPRTIIEDLISQNRLPANVATDSEAEKAIKLIDKTYGILSLTAVKDNLLMWAHYSAAHTGAVIRIDIADTDFAKGGDDFQEQDEVQYDDDDALPEIPQNIQDVLVKDHFFTKSKEWKYEEEYRIVRYLKNKTETIACPGQLYDIYLFDLPPSCIQELIFGVRCEEEMRNTITAKISKSPQLQHIKLKQAKLSLDHFKLKFEEWSLEKQKQVAEEKLEKQKQVAEEKQKKLKQRILEETIRQQMESNNKRILEDVKKLQNKLRGIQ